MGEASGQGSEGNLPFPEVEITLLGAELTSSWITIPFALEWDKVGRREEAFLKHLKGRSTSVPIGKEPPKSIFFAGFSS